jgi:hypothetical protein
MQQGLFRISKCGTELVNLYLRYIDSLGDFPSSPTRRFCGTQAYGNWQKHTGTLPVEIF